MKNKLAFSFFIVALQFANAQEILFKGKVEADGNYVGGINIVNLVNEKSTMTDDDGRFQILAKPEDLIIFSSLFYEYKRRIIEAEDMESQMLIIQMIPKPYLLEAVEIVQYANITAYDLGILKTKPKQYTVAERRMKSKFGSKADRKANLEIEKREMLIERITYLFEKEYYIEKLKIQPDYLMAFKYFCAESDDFRATVKQNDLKQIENAIKQLAAVYNYYQKEETEKE